VEKFTEAFKQKGVILPPKCMFIPSRKIMRMVIKANLMYSKGDNMAQFLLRFGLIDDPNWYLKRN
jgi:hypothetical protein